MGNIFESTMSYTNRDIVDGVDPIVAVLNTDEARELAVKWSKLTQIKTVRDQFAMVMMMVRYHH